MSWVFGSQVRHLLRRYGPCGCFYDREMFLQPVTHSPLPVIVETHSSAALCERVCAVDHNKLSGVLWSKLWFFMRGKNEKIGKGEMKHGVIGSAKYV